MRSLGATICSGDFLRFCDSCVFLSRAVLYALPSRENALNKEAAPIGKELVEVPVLGSMLTSTSWMKRFNIATLMS